MKLSILASALHFSLLTLAVNSIGTDARATGAAYCLGDGSGTACPCANSGAPGNGCANSGFAVGGNLSATGFASDQTCSGVDTLVLTATNIPAVGMFIQGSATLGNGFTFGDGLICVGGTIRRLGVVAPTLGVASYPGGLGSNPIHIQGATVSGTTLNYQFWYRDVPNFCTISTFNLTNGLAIGWNC